MCGGGRAPEEEGESETGCACQTLALVRGVHVSTTGYHRAYDLRES